MPKRTNIVNIHHVMWQPTLSCLHRCANCYLKTFSENKKEKQEFKATILDLIYKYQTVKCSQFTISLNTISKFDEKVVAVLANLWQREKEEGDPALCVTAHDINTVIAWITAMGLSLSEFIKPLTILSLSKLPVGTTTMGQLQQVCQDAHVKINYNKVVQEDTALSSQFIESCKEADQVYLVLNKSPLGEKQDSDSLKEWFAAHEVASKYSKQLMQDLCVRESCRYVSGGFTCSAGISRIHIWPDETVTSCPYDARGLYSSSPKRDGHKSLKESIEAVMKVSKDWHPIMKCGIPQILEEGGCHA